MIYYPIIERCRYTKKTLRLLGYADTRTMPPHTEYLTPAVEVIFGEPVRIASR